MTGAMHFLVARGAKLIVVHQRFWTLDDDAITLLSECQIGQLRFCDNYFCDIVLVTYCRPVTVV